MFEEVRNVSDVQPASCQYMSRHVSESLEGVVLHVEGEIVVVVGVDVVGFVVVDDDVVGFDVVGFTVFGVVVVDVDVVGFTVFGGVVVGAVVVLSSAGAAHPFFNVGIPLTQGTIEHILVTAVFATPCMSCFCAV